MSTTKKKAVKRTRRKRMKGSQRPYTRHSTMSTQQGAAPAAGVQIFAKVTSGIGNQATEGDLYRRLTNTHATLYLSVGETAAQAAGATAYKLPPGQTLPLMGTEGVGWAGDVFVAESTSACTYAALSF